MKLTTSPQPFSEARNNKSASRILVESILAEHTKRGGISIPRIAEIAGIDVSTVRKALTPLRDLHQLVNVGTMRSPVYLLSGAPLPTTAQPIKFVSKDTYDGAELRPYEGRPGAMTAYSLPSLKDGARVPYNGIRPMLVGSLKDNTNNGR